MDEIARLNREIKSRYDDPAGIADLEDRRDGFIDQLSQLMDIKVIEADRGRGPRVHGGRQSAGGYAGGDTELR